MTKREKSGILYSSSLSRTHGGSELLEERVDAIYGSQKEIKMNSEKTFKELRHIIGEKKAQKMYTEIRQETIFAHYSMEEVSKYALGTECGAFRHIVSVIFPDFTGIDSHMLQKYVPDPVTGFPVQAGEEYQVFPTSKEKNILFLKKLRSKLRASQQTGEVTLLCLESISLD